MFTQRTVVGYSFNSTTRRGEGSEERSEIVGSISINDVNIPVRRVTYGNVEGLPPEQPDTIYVVSTFVTIALQEKGLH